MKMTMVNSGLKELKRTIKNLQERILIRVLIEPFEPESLSPSVPPRGESLMLTECNHHHTRQSNYTQHEQLQAQVDSIMHVLAWRWWTGAQGQKPVSAYLVSKQILPFGEYNAVGLR